MQQADLSELSGINWDDLRIVLACAEAGGFRAAGRATRIDAATVKRRIERLERALGLKLFVRTQEGVVPTDHGQAIVDGARGMERALCDIGRKKSFADLVRRTTVALAITEGLGSYWLMPQLVGFQREHPTTLVDLKCAMASVDVLRLEADISVQFERPTSQDLIVARIAQLHLSSFASPEYVKTYGMPESPDDFAGHRFVLQRAPNLDDAAFAGFFGLDESDLTVALRTNASTAHLYAIEKGAGIGVLPNYAMALGAEVIPVPAPGRYALDVWMTYHPELQADEGKMDFVGWLRTAFAPSRFPWFGKDYLTPEECIEEMDEDLRNGGRGYLATGTPNQPDP